MAITNRCGCCGTAQLEEQVSKKIKFFLNYKKGSNIYCESCYKKNVSFFNRIKNFAYRFSIRIKMSMCHFRNKFVFRKS